MESRPIPRKSRSPNRQRLSALSPLQAFSPLNEARSASPPAAGFTSASSVGRSRGHSRSSSSSSTYSSAAGTTLRRSLSSRERVFRRDSGAGEEYPSGITTRLILVKAPPQAQQQQPQEPQENMPPLRQRSKSSSNLPPIAAAAEAAAATNIPPTSARSPRRSFAAASFSSFAAPLSPMSPINQNIGEGDRPGSIALARRPSYGSLSISTAAANSGSVTGQPKVLSPEEVYNLARGVMSPVLAPEHSGSEYNSGAGLKRSKSAGGLTRSKSIGGFVSLSRSSSAAAAPGSAQHTPVAEAIELEPFDYVPMDEDTLLPFSDRPKQVDELLHNPVNADMLQLLKAAFPKAPDGKPRDNWKYTDVTKWTWEEFLLHLTVTDRKECPDYEWVLLARTAVRAHAVAVWEKLGACLGCDSELITAGDEDETPASWGGLGLGDEGEYDPALSRVHIEALEAMDPEELDEQERMLSQEFAEPVDTDAMGLWSSSYGLETETMETIGEKEEPGSGSSGGSSAALGLNQPISPFTSVASLPGTKNGNNGNNSNSSNSNSSSSSNNNSSGKPARDYFAAQATDRTPSTTSLTSDSSSAPSSPERQKDRLPGKRSRSFVGLQIVTVTPDLRESHSVGRSPRSAHIGMGSPPGIGMVAPQFERTPGNPLFVSSFNTLSLAPNLGRKQSTGYSGPGHAEGYDYAHQMRKQRPIVRKLSGTGMSESAITFVSDSSGF